ncbi:hypothetical protein CDD81_5631 [Ophiocordyceps australis]|uniref:Uncharacterized protein n=1 Tax=Ophiocordyceps australis TaxID=1399860 RepID=A0A2C5Y881_9HYPO|nr:hypothetical protein CDD81_5631 [Ophiocordyceps australis]
MASQAPEAKTVSEPDFVGGIVPESEVWVRFDLKGGHDPIYTPEFDRLYELPGAPAIAGAEIKSSMPVKLLGWTSNPNEPPVLIVEGPTGKSKEAQPPVRVGIFRVERR